jgi:hypothetical protein
MDVKGAERSDGGAKGTKSKHKPTPHPTLRWEQLPEFFKALDLNKANGSHITICAVKVLLQTFLRFGAGPGSECRC